MKRAAVLLGLSLGAMVLGVFCAGFGALGDWVVSYRVVNDTNQPLITRHMDADCSRPARHQHAYTEEMVIPSHSSVDYYQTVGKFDGGCVQVATTDRTLVRAFDYEEGAEYVVAQLASESNDTLPAREDLPREPFSVDSALSRLKERPLIAVGLTLLAIGAIGAFAAMALGGVSLFRTVLGTLRRRAASP